MIHIKKGRQKGKLAGLPVLGTEGVPVLEWEEAGERDGAEAWA